MSDCHQLGMNNRPLLVWCICICIWGTFALESRCQIDEFGSPSVGNRSNVCRSLLNAPTPPKLKSGLDNTELLEMFLTACTRHWKLNAPKIFVPNDFVAKLMLKSQSRRFVASLVVRNNIRPDLFNSIHFREISATQMIIVGSKNVVTSLFFSIMEMNLLSPRSIAVLVCLDCSNATAVTSFDLTGHDVLGQIVLCFPTRGTITSGFVAVTLIFDYRSRRFVTDKVGRWSVFAGFNLTAIEFKTSHNFLKLGHAILSILAAQENTPFVIRRNDTPKKPAVGGYVGHLIKVLSELMEFRFNVVYSAETTYGGSNSGLIAEFVQKRYDVGVGVFSMSIDRLSAVDFTTAIAETPTTFVMQRPSKLLGTAWNLCVRPFTAALWWAVLVLSVVSSLFLAAAVRWTRRVERLPDDSWMPAIMSVWLMQGDDYIPTMASAKTTITLTSFACWILLSIYNSFLVTFLALDTTPIMSSIEQLAKSGIKVGVAKGVVALDLLQTSTDDNVESMEGRITATDSHSVGLDKVCASTRFAQLVSVPVAFDYAARRQQQMSDDAGSKSGGVQRQCQIYALKEVFFVDRYHFITQKGNALSSRMSMGLTRIRESGVLSRLAKNSRVTIRDTAGRSAGDLQTWAIITLTHMAIPFACLVGGGALALAALMVEIIYYRHFGQVKRRHRTVIFSLQTKM